MSNQYILIFDNGEYWDGNKTTPDLNHAKTYFSLQQAFYIVDLIYANKKIQKPNSIQIKRKEQKNENK